MNDYKFSCLIGDLNISNWQDITKILTAAFNDVTIEQNPHISISCGLDPSKTLQSLSDIQSLVLNREITINLNKVDMFLTEEYVILKFNLDDNIDLIELNKDLMNIVKNEGEYQEYHPHVTIAYLKKSDYNEMILNFNSDAFFTINKYYCSFPEMDELNDIETEKGNRIRVK